MQADVSILRAGQAISHRRPIQRSHRDPRAARAATGWRGHRMPCLPKGGGASRSTRHGEVSIRIRCGASPGNEKPVPAGIRPLASGPIDPRNPVFHRAGPPATPKDTTPCQTQAPHLASQATPNAAGRAAAKTATNIPPKKAAETDNTAVAHPEPRNSVRALTANLLQLRPAN